MKNDSPKQIQENQKLTARQGFGRLFERLEPAMRIVKSGNRQSAKTEERLTMTTKP